VGSSCHPVTLSSEGAPMAFDAFLELLTRGKPAVTGETLDEEFKPRKAMEIASFKLQSQRDMTDGDASDGLTEGTTLFQLSVTKEVDNATPDLYLAYCKQASSREANYDLMRLTVRKAAGATKFTYLVLQFANVFVKSWKLENSDDGLPEEKV